MTGLFPHEAGDGFMPAEAILAQLEMLLGEACRIADAAKLDLAAIKIEEARYIAREQLHAGGTIRMSGSNRPLN